MLKILHLAPQNFAGVPYDYYKMHNFCGDYSRLITYHKTTIKYPEDICLELPLPNFDMVKKWRRRKVVNKESELNDLQKFNPYFEYKSSLEKIYFPLNDLLKTNKINKVIKKYNLNDFDIFHYDGGLDFFRFPKQAIKWKSEGKKIVCCYYGSDLRVRGLIKELDEISDLNITSEYDHLKLKKNINYLFYPYDISELPNKLENNSNKIRIVHSPTNRVYKGTNLIIEVIEKIKKEKNIEFILLENKPREEVLRIKSQCDICIDQVGGMMGGTGYGKAGLETLGMGIPTVTNMTPDYKEWLPENPFSVANNSEELYSILSELISDASLRSQKGYNGRFWVIKYHGYENVNNRLHELYKSHGLV